MNNNVIVGVYGPASGIVVFQIHRNTSDGGKPVSVLLTEHKPVGKKQYQYSFDQTTEEIRIPGGVYTLQAVLAGYEVYRSLVTVQPDTKTEVLIDFKKARPYQPGGFESLLQPYGMKATDIKHKTLHVKRDKKVVLNSAHLDLLTTKTLQATSISDIKKWIGKDDKYFPGDVPAFGEIPGLADFKPAQIEKAEKGSLLTQYLQSPATSRQIGSGPVAIFGAIANEYIYGNSKSVRQYEPLLSKMVSVYKFPLNAVFADTIIVEPGATLELGTGCNILTCNVLKVSRTGTVRVTAQAKIQATTYETF